MLKNGISGLQSTYDDMVETYFPSLWHMGFGAVNARSLLGIGYNTPGVNALFRNILLANLPQVILSFLYPIYNGLYTCMLLADEWSRFAHQRKSLRVTSPSGLQRSTYYLQLPYVYSLPLLIISGAVHWLVSQSFFLARLTVFTADGSENSFEDISACGYSCIAIIFVIIVGSIMVIASILNGFRRFKPGMPLAGSCSAVISAACHALPEDVDAAYLPVMWGVVSKADDGVEHYAFSSQEVSLPAACRSDAGKNVPGLKHKSCRFGRWIQLPAWALGCVAGLFS